MNAPVAWYRSAEAAPAVRRTLRRVVRDWVCARLPRPAVRGRTIVLHSRRTLPVPSSRGFRSQYHGLFSEFHSVVGALAYGRAHGAAGVRVDFRSPLYVDAARGPNWWEYFFESAVMRIDDEPTRPAEEVHLDRVLTRYGRYGGFSDIVHGATPYLYPMTHGIDRRALNRLVTTFVSLRVEIRDEASQRVASLLDPEAFVVGVHYRGTDAVHRLAGMLRHYRTTRVPYAAFAGEVRRVLAAAAPVRYQLFVATDETAFVDFMSREFPGRVAALDAPRARPDGAAVHLDSSAGASNYDKGKSAVIDALLLASTDYLVKGRSNLSDASLLFNPDLPYSFCPDVDW
jgi:hypothetical protein